tara:strand:+ start:7838 stop:9112 length:1275 start_codon:yes stop_codon:yes gene_type:complete
MIANVVSRQTFPAVALQLNYPFVISYFENEAITIFKVYVNGVLKAPIADYDIVETADINGISPGGSLNFTAQPTAGDDIKIVRFTPRTQNSTFGGTYAASGPVEATFDRTIMIAQEIQDELTEAGLAPAPVVNPTNVVTDWAQGVNYLADELVINAQGLYRVVNDHLSTTFSVDLAAGDMEIIGTFGIRGETGAQGGQGNQGIQGIQGLAGNNGVDGNDGIFSQKADLAEAQAGVDDTKGMTPLKTKSAIDTQVPALPVVTTLQADVNTNLLSIGALATEVLILQNVVEASHGVWAGEQVLQNAAGPTDILGLTSGEGNGKPFLRDGDGTRHATIMVSIERVTDLERRFSSFNLIMQFVDNQWFIKRDKTHVLDDSLEVDGVTLTVNNLPGKEGQLQYTTDNMVGVYDLVESKIKYKGVELSEV